MSTINLKRREVLKISTVTVATAAVSTLAAPLLLSGCKKNSTSQNDINFKELEIKPCEGKEKLSAQETSIRNSLKYVDSSPINGRTCDNCKLYTLATKKSCGGCKVVPGPIHPKGYCTAWMHLM